MMKPMQEIKTIEDVQELAEPYNIYLDTTYGYDGDWGYDKETYFRAFPNITVDDLDVKYVLWSEERYAVVAKYTNTKELLNNAAKDITDFGKIPGNYSVYLSMQNPLIINGEGANWDDIQGMETNEWVKEIAEGNYTNDGIIFKGISDYGGKGYKRRPVSDVYVVFNPTQIKVYLQQWYV